MSKTMYNPFLIGALKKCETGQEVDNTFIKRKITNREKQMKYLLYCMGNPEVFYGGREEEDREKELDSQYVTLRSMFITGSWRY
jgi:hypothetical protein